MDKKTFDAMRCKSVEYTISRMNENREKTGRSANKYKGNEIELDNMIVYASKLMHQILPDNRWRKKALEQLESCCLWSKESLRWGLIEEGDLPDWRVYL